MKNMIKKKYLKPGNQYNGRYHIIQVLKVNEQSSTYLAKDMMKQSLKFLKYMHIQPTQQKKIKDEYKLINQLQHFNIIRGYECCSQSDQQGTYLGIIMEYIEGRDLINLSDKLTSKEILKIYAQLKSVVEYLQTKKNIHLDLNIQNILLDEDDNPKVIPFQHATLLKQLQVIETKELDLKNFTTSDNLWQLGIILIQLATNKKIEQLMNGYDPVSNPDFPEQIYKNYGIGGILRRLIQPLLKKDIKERRFCEQIDFIDSGNILKLKRTTNQQIQLILDPHLDNLLQLYCHNCLLTDQCGKYINKIGILHKLDVSGNNLTDKFTYYIKKLLAQLKTLKIAFTNITDDSISLLVAKSKQLQQLDISYTLVTSDGIIMLPKLNKLQSLALWSGDKQYYPQRYEEIINMKRVETKYSNNRKEINQQFIKQMYTLRLTELCVNAEGIDIDDLIICRMNKQATCVQVRGRINNKTVEYICNMRKLERIYLKEVEIKYFKSTVIKSCALVSCKLNINHLIKSLEKCEQLESLNLQNIGISKKGVIQIAKNLKNLTSLNLANNKIDKQGVIEIVMNLNNLTSLNLGNNEIGDDGVIEISKNLKNLTSLDLNENSIGKQGAIAIAKNLKNLMYLNLGLNNIGQQGAIQISKNLKDLTSLDLRNNNIGKQGAIEIAKNLTNLTSLDLSFNQIGRQGAVEISKNLTNLTSLDLNWNNIGSQGVIEIAKNLKNLITLSLEGNEFGKQAAIQIAKNLNNLTSLNLKNNYTSNQGVIEIAKNLKTLICLSLQNNKIGKQGGIKIAKNLTNLTFLDLSNNNICNQGAIEIATNLKHLTYLYLSNNSIGNSTNKLIREYLPNTILTL